MQSPVAKKARFELPDHGDLFTMGDQISKELGPREIYFHGRKTLRSQPAKVRIGSYKIKQVAMGALHTLALTVNGQILSFGCNDDYVLGRIITREEYLNDKITTNGGDNDDKNNGGIVVFDSSVARNELKLARKSEFIGNVS